MYVADFNRRSRILVAFDDQSASVVVDEKTTLMVMSIVVSVGVICAPKHTH